MFASKEEIRSNMVELLTKSTPNDHFSANKIVSDAEILSNYIINGSLEQKDRCPSQSSNTGGTAQDNNHAGLTLVFGFHPQHRQS